MIKYTPIYTDILILTFFLYVSTLVYVTKTIEKNVVLAFPLHRHMYTGNA